ASQDELQAATLAASRQRNHLQRELLGDEILVLAERAVNVTAKIVQCLDVRSLIRHRVASKNVRVSISVSGVVCGWES
ncbi:MAG: hypothetical protein H7062_02250, partial [Candidatus Saccharimonas sp.]|nr:hypothetical protein [Planctomycetaceae bacterium]